PTCGPAHGAGSASRRDLPEPRHQAMCCLLVVAVLLTQHPGQLGLFDRDARQQSQQRDGRADHQGQPVTGAEAETDGDQRQSGVGGVPHHRYGPRVTTAWPASTWTNVLNDPPSVSTAQTRTAKPTQITTSPAAANACGTGVSSAGTHCGQWLPMKIDPPRESGSVAAFGMRPA